MPLLWMGISMAKETIQIIYQDADIIVINKPAGVSTTKDRAGKPAIIPVLQNQLAIGEQTKLRLVHRLDKDASGVMFLAKNLQAQSKLSSDFEKRLVKKTYLALVRGPATQPHGTISSPLARHRKNPQLMCIGSKRGKPALTNWRLLANFGSVSLLAVYPLTGRTHQVRVHLAASGMPLAVDSSYGSSQPIFLSEFKADYRLGKEKAERPLIDRLGLHCYELQLPNPPPQCPASFIAPLDAKFTACIKMLAKHNPKGLDAFVNPDDFSNIINTQRLFGG